jgi:hypothetical protein
LLLASPWLRSAAIILAAVVALQVMLSRIWRPATPEPRPTQRRV